MEGVTQRFLKSQRPRLSGLCLFVIASEGELVAVGITDDEIAHAVDPVGRFAPMMRTRGFDPGKVMINLVTDDVRIAAADARAVRIRRAEVNFALPHPETHVSAVPE